MGGKQKLCHNVNDKITKTLCSNPLCVKYITQQQGNDLL